MERVHDNANAFIKKWKQIVNGQSLLFNPIQDRGQKASPLPVFPL